MRNVERVDSNESWLIDVNDHNIRTYEFPLSAEVVYSQNPLVELCKRGVIVEPFWANEMLSHLFYDYKQCLQTRSIVYRNTVLGWYPFDGEYYYFYDKTKFAGNDAITERKGLKFSSGDKENYLAFLRNTVFPSVELSLALSIGYSAVVASRVNTAYDLGTIIVNLCGISSTGKSTAEMLMCSPFACPEFSNREDSLCFTANSTQNAIFAMIDGIHGVPFVIDDITTNPYINMSQFIYALADGNPKARCNGDGKLRDDGYGWSGVAMTSSETPILDFAVQNQGLKVRVLHTQGITWTKDANEAELVKRTVRQHYGFTGKEFADYVASLPFDILCEKFEASCEVVKAMMTKKDALSSRLANKFAVIHLTVQLLNEAFNYGLSADTVTERIVRCEQETFDERDNASKAFDLVIDFITQKSAHFDIETRLHSSRIYSDTYASGEFYGKIFKYDDAWIVHIIASKTTELLKSKGMDELKWIRREWNRRGITEGDCDHCTKQKYYNGIRVRCDCFTIPGGIALPTSYVPEPPSTPAIPQDTPVSTYTVDDTAQIEQIFGGNDGN